MMTEKELLADAGRLKRKRQALWTDINTRMKATFDCIRTSREALQKVEVEEAIVWGSRGGLGPVQD